MKFLLQILFIYAYFADIITYCKIFKIRNLKLSHKKNTPVGAALVNNFGITSNKDKYGP